MSRLKWGISTSLSAELSEPVAVAELAVSAEAAGWDGFFVWDHLWNRTGEPFADPWVTLAAVAVATDQIAIGTLVTPLPRRRPQVLAQQAATLDRLADGRLILGLGLGHDGYGEYSTFDEPRDTARSRAQALDAGIDFLVQALTGAVVESAGRRTTIPTRRRPRFPIWVAGRTGVGAGPRRARRHELEGVAIVGESVWSPAHVTDVLERGEFAPGETDVVLTGGEHPSPDRLAAAGATWAIPELMPGTTRTEALQQIQQAPY
ncbi:MAG TPA: LLM class flavin-dependent oxidoreductase [Acidimicrobiia bacterium]|nr:LLM class flavin-dependent oxidoreductase [Acidimicrobiia bacterium]